MICLFIDSLIWLSPHQRCRAEQGLDARLTSVFLCGDQSNDLVQTNCSMHFNNFNKLIIVKLCWHFLFLLSIRTPNPPWVMIVKLLIIIIGSLWGSGLSLHALAFSSQQILRDRFIQTKCILCQISVQELKLYRHSFQIYSRKSKVEWPGHFPLRILPAPLSVSLSTSRAVVCKHRLQTPPATLPFVTYWHIAVHILNHNTAINTAPIFAQSLLILECVQWACEHRIEN